MAFVWWSKKASPADHEAGRIVHTVAAGQTTPTTLGRLADGIGIGETDGTTALPAPLDRCRSPIKNDGDQALRSHARVLPHLIVCAHGLFTRVRSWNNLPPE